MHAAPEPFVLTGGPIFTGSDLLYNHAVRIQNGVVSDITHQDQADSSLDTLDVRGRLIVPGFVCAHHHFYSALATGMSVAPSQTFAEKLEHLWWKLDRALSPNDIRLSARWSLAQCVKNGVTTIFDHHASYCAIPGSLECIADEIQTAGVRGGVCFEISDRNGPEAAHAALLENRDFKDRPAVKHLCGLHASFTLSDDSLAAARDATPDSIGFHLHCAEDLIDVERSNHQLVKRLDRFGILRPDTLLIHGIHLRPDEYDMIAARGSTLVHCPDSNLHNGVGTLDITTALSAGIALAAGTDGMHSSMLKTYKTALLANHNLRGRPDTGFDETRRMYRFTQQLPERFFPDYCGNLKPGARADIAVLDYRPHTPLTTDTVWGHMLYGAAEQPVFTTIAGGAILYNHDVLSRVDEQALTRECRSAAARLWKRS